MTTRMRFRTDSMQAAEAHYQLIQHGQTGEPHCCDDPACDWHPENFLKVPPMAPGDTWRSHWYQSEAVAGYWICCVKCGELHPWTTANNCSSRRQLPDNGGWTCDHSGKGSCWDWSGSAEENTLTGHPSLLCHTCGWHGWLRDGVLSDA